MSIFKNAAGREIELSVYGKHDDDIQVDEATFVDGAEGEEVPDADVEYILDAYASEIYELWYEGKIGEAEYCSDMER